MVNQYLFPDITSTLSVTKARELSKIVIGLLNLTTPHYTKSNHAITPYAVTTPPHLTTPHYTKPNQLP